MADHSQQFIVDAHGAVLNNDEQEWLKYKAARDNILLVQKLKKQVDYLLKKVLELEERLNEATTKR